MSLPAATPTAEPATPETAIDPSLCPRCGGKLANPDGLGWCAKCGYCRSLEEETTATAAMPAEDERPAAKPSPLGAAEFAETMRLLPGWAWPLLGGVFLIAAVSWAGNLLLDEVCLARAAWSAGQLMLCALGLVGAQLWVIMLVGEGDANLGAKDALMPGRVWVAAARRLPATRQPVWLGAWCMTGIVCALAMVGGFGYWLELVREARDARKVREAAERAEGAPEKSPSFGPTETAEQARAAAEGKATAPCVVIGYQTDGTGNLTGLLVATTSGDKLTYAGTVTAGLTDQASKSLMRQLSRLNRNDSLIPGLKVKGTFWVKPGVFCDVAHAGAEKSGELKDARFKGMTE